MSNSVHRRREEGTDRSHHSASFGARSGGIRVRRSWLRLFWLSVVLVGAFAGYLASSSLGERLLDREIETQLSRLLQGEVEIGEVDLRWEGGFLVEARDFSACPRTSPESTESGSPSPRTAGAARARLGRRVRPAGRATRAEHARPRRSPPARRPAPRRPFRRPPDSARGRVSGPRARRPVRRREALRWTGFPRPRRLDLYGALSRSRPDRDHRRHPELARSARAQRAGRGACTAAHRAVECGLRARLALRRDHARNRRRLPRWQARALPRRRPSGDCPEGDDAHFAWSIELSHIPLDAARRRLPSSNRSTACRAPSTPASVSRPKRAACIGCRSPADRRRAHHPPQLAAAPFA